YLRHIENSMARTATEKQKEQENDKENDQDDDKHDHDRDRDDHKAANQKHHNNKHKHAKEQKKHKIHSKNAAPDAQPVVFPLAAVWPHPPAESRRLARGQAIVGTRAS